MEARICVLRLAVKGDPFCARQLTVQNDLAILADLNEGLDLRGGNPPRSHLQSPDWL